MQFFSRRCQPRFFPDGTAGSCPSSNSTPPQSTLNTPPTGFVLNGLPLGPQSGAPFADPAVDDNGNPINYNPVTKVQDKRVYKAAAIQMNVDAQQAGAGMALPATTHAHIVGRCQSDSFKHPRNRSHCSSAATLATSSNTGIPIWSQTITWWTISRCAHRPTSWASIFTW